jgi:UDP-N-acetylmuramate: L-alanyl-gamma-D-glutamyl-meso-diaminopimelate ligase
MNIHLIGIAGSAMGNLAAMLKQIGHKVTGSDSGVYPPMSEKLKFWNIKFNHKFDRNQVHKKDLVIVGNAISRGNAELEELLNLKIPYMSLPEALKYFFLKNKEVICIAGTHGKSTTSALIAYLLEKCGKDPSYFIGGVGLEGKESFRLGKGRYFVIEGDEYDSAYFDKSAKFFHYKPKFLILTSLEYDHADIYNSIDEIQLAFARLCNMIPQNGLIIANHDYKPLTEVIGSLEKFNLHKVNRKKRNQIKASFLKNTNQKLKIYSKILRYGSPSQINFKFKKNENAAFELKMESGFQYYQKGEIKVFFPLCDIERESQIYHVPHYGKIQTKLIGEHNALNMCAASLLARELKLDLKKVKSALRNFPGILRRQTICVQKPFVLIDDFAHHPTAVQETIKAVKEVYLKRKIWVLFEPRSASAHLNVFQNQWPKAFTIADKLFITDLYNPEKFDKKKMLNVKKVVGECKSNTEFFQNPSDLFDTIKKKISKIIDEKKICPVLLVMTNGDFGGLVQKLTNLAKDF